MRLKNRLDNLEAARRTTHEAWLRGLSHDKPMAYYRDLERNDPEQMAYLQTLTNEQLQKVADGSKL